MSSILDTTGDEGKSTTLDLGAAVSDTTPSIPATQTFLDTTAPDGEDVITVSNGADASRTNSYKHQSTGPAKKEKDLSMWLLSSTTNKLTDAATSTMLDEKTNAQLDALTDAAKTVGTIGLAGLGLHAAFTALGVKGAWDTSKEKRATRKAAKAAFQEADVKTRAQLVDDFAKPAAKPLSTAADASVAVARVSEDLTKPVTQAAVESTTETVARVADDVAKPATEAVTSTLDEAAKPAAEAVTSTLDEAAKTATAGAPDALKAVSDVMDEKPSWGMRLLTALPRSIVKPVAKLVPALGAGVVAAYTYSDVQRLNEMGLEEVADAQKLLGAYEMATSFGGIVTFGASEAGVIAMREAFIEKGGAEYENLTMASTQALTLGVKDAWNSMSNDGKPPVEDNPTQKFAPNTLNM